MSKSFEEFIEEKRILYKEDGIEGEEWEKHRLFLELGNLLGYSIDEIELYSNSQYTFKKKGIILFALISELLDKNTLIEGLMDPTISINSLLKKHCYKELVNEIESTSNHIELINAIYNSAFEITKLSKDLASIRADNDNFLITSFNRYLSR